MIATRTNTRSPTIKRILREAAEMSSSPSPDYDAQPLESDFFEWHFTLRGPPNSAYSQGIYHGRILLPSAYPLRPPMFRFSTPNGRFEANREICLSISGHHEETWQPAWGIRTALVALRSFMETDARGQLGGLDTCDDFRRQLAEKSGAWTCPTCAKTNAEIMQACTERCEQSEDKTGSEVVVPEELTMVWKDDIKAKPEAKEAAAPGGKGEEGELAEGFVETRPQPVEPVPQRPVTALPGVAQVDNHTAANRAVNATPQGTRVAAGSSQTLDGNTPLWIDRAISVLGILLVALLMKVLLGL